MWRCTLFVLCAAMSGAVDPADLRELPAELRPDREKLKDVADGKPATETAAWLHLLELAHKGESRLPRYARRNVTHADLMKDPPRYRGDLICLEGTLARIRRYDPTAESKKLGIKDEYEAWIFDQENYGSKPVCVYLTQLPEGIELGERVNVPVVYSGYFFKRYRYKTGARDKNGDVYREAPLLLGHLQVGFLPVFLLLNARAELVIDGQEKPIADVEGKKKHIVNLATLVKKKYADHKDPVAQVPVVIETAAEAPYADVHEIWTMCKEAGFRKLQLRTFRPKEKSKS